MKKKRCIALLLTVSMLATGLAACGGNDSGGESAGTPGDGGTESAADINFDEEP